MIMKQAHTAKNQKKIEKLLIVQKALEIKHQLARVCNACYSTT